MFRIFLITPARKDLKSLSPEIRNQIDSVYFPLLSADPYIGKALKPPFKGYRSFSFTNEGKEYRILYKIEKNELVVLIIMVGSRENIYDKLKRRI